MRIVLALWAAQLALIAAATAHPESASHTHLPHAAEIPARELRFPDTSDGRKILPVDLHTHSVFSDGHVWPTVRVWEAQRDGLAALAVTEHLEYQPHRDDIPHPDRNRAYELTQQAMERYARDELLIIPGAEITRKLSPGHVNAIFIKDANPLLTIDKRSEDTIDNARIALEEARAQGGFTFWNHPAWPRDFPTGVLSVPEEQARLFADGLLQGIEVANGLYFSEDALQVALDYGLVILGTSDIHGLIDYDYDLAAGQHRTVTLALSPERSLQGIEAALRASETVALYDSHLIGRPDQVAAVVDAVLSMEIGNHRRNSTILQLRIKNDGPVDMRLRNLGENHFSNASDIIDVPAYGAVEVNLVNTPEKTQVTIPVEVLNAYVAPRRHHVHVLQGSFGPFRQTGITTHTPDDPTVAPQIMPTSAGADLIFPPLID